MKKLLTLMLIVVLTLALTACGGDTPEGSNDNPNAKVDPQIALAEQLAGFAGQGKYNENTHVTDVVVALPTAGGSILPALEAQLGELSYYGSDALSEQLVGIVFEGKYTDTLTPNAWVLLADQRWLAAEADFDGYPTALSYSRSELEHVDRPAILLDTEELTYTPPSTAAGYTKNLKLTILLDGTDLLQSLSQKQSEYQQTADAIPGQYALNKNGKLDIINDTRTAEPDTWTSNPEVLAMCDGSVAIADYVMYCGAAEWLAALASQIETAPEEQWASILAAHLDQHAIDNQIIALREQQYALYDRYPTYKMMAEYDQQLFAAEIEAIANSTTASTYTYEPAYAAILAQAPDLLSFENLQREIDWYSKQIGIWQEIAAHPATYSDDKLVDLLWQNVEDNHTYDEQMWATLLQHGQALVAEDAAAIAACEAEEARIAADRDAVNTAYTTDWANRCAELARRSDDTLLMPYLLGLSGRIGEINTQPVEKTAVLGELDDFTIIKINAAQVQAIDDAREISSNSDSLGLRCNRCAKDATHLFEGGYYCDDHYSDAVLDELLDIAAKN